MANAPHDDNRSKAILAVSNADDSVTLPAKIDSTSRRLLVDAVISAGGSAGSEYSEGDTDATITGGVAMAEGTSNTIRPIKSDDDGHLQVDILSGGSGGTEYDDGDIAPANPTGTIPVFDDGGTIKAVSDTNPLPVSASIDTTGLASEAKQDTQITSLAAIKTAVEILDNAISGNEIQADIVAALPAGNNNIGDVDIATITAGDNNIGNVDIVTLPGDVEADIDQIRDQIDLITPDIEEIRVDSEAIKVSTEIMDDWDESDRAKVNLIVGQAGVQGASGTVSATTQRVVLATDVALPTGTNAIGRVGHDVTGIGHGVTTVTTAGTDVALAASTACKRVDIQAQTDNTNIIAIGGSGVDAVIATGTGIALNPGDVYSLEIDNLADIFIDSLVNGEGVRYTYYT